MEQKYNPNTEEKFIVQFLVFFSTFFFGKEKGERKNDVGKRRQVGVRVALKMTKNILRVHEGEREKEKERGVELSVGCNLMNCSPKKSFATREERKRKKKGFYKALKSLFGRKKSFHSVQVQFSGYMRMEEKVMYSPLSERSENKKERNSKKGARQFSIKLTLCILLYNVHSIPRIHSNQNLLSLSSSLPTLKKNF